MANENEPTQGQQAQQNQPADQARQTPAPAAQGQEAAAQAQGEARGEENFDGLADKKPEELTPEELRLMADTMPGEGPGD